MNDAKSTIILLACCCIVLTIAPSASADFIGVTTVIKDDPDTDFQCTQGNGVNVPGPLTVCNVYAAFDDPNNKFLSVDNADLQVFNGANPQVNDVFYFHPFGNAPTSPHCTFIPAFPDLICTSFITIGVKCAPPLPGQDGTAPDGDFNAVEFAFNGHVVGGWFNANVQNGQGEAGNNPDMQVLFLQSSVAEGLSLSGTINIFWRDEIQGDIFAELAVPIECVASCGSCTTDTDGDGDTDAADLAVLLGNWGPFDGGDCQDADDDGLIGPFDLAVLLGAWGPCP